MLVSIIIPTKNEEKNIENCLKSIKNQTYPQNILEIIVVDNKSSDKTKEIATRYTDKIFNEGPERSAQRNFGINKSKGDYFIFLDADMFLSKDVIKNCVDKITNNPSLVALYIPEIITGKRFFSRVRRFERSFYDGTVIDCVRFIKKETFQKSGGFDEALTGPEDWDLDKKIRQAGPVEIIKSPLYHNEAEFDLKKYLQKKSYYIGKFDDYIKKWGKNDPDVKKQFSVYYRYFGVFSENGKWKRLLAHPILASGMYFLRFLVGVKFLLR